MKVLLTGANGLLGQELINLLLNNNYQVIGASKGPNRIDYAGSNFVYQELDITDGPAVYKALHDHKPDLIIHAAAMTQVDDCELNKIDCYNVNVTATNPNVLGKIFSVHPIGGTPWIRTQVEGSELTIVENTSSEDIRVSWGGVFVLHTPPTDTNKGRFFSFFQ